MTPEKVIELANQAGITFITKAGVASATEEWLCGFAQLVRNETLEEAERTCIAQDVESFGVLPIRAAMITTACAEAIRNQKS